MKKFLLAAAGLAAVTAAAPAAAQYQPYGYGYGYGQPQGYGYNQRGIVNSYIVRADRLRQAVERLDSRDRISEREARRLRSDAAELQRRARAYANNGLSWNERADLDRRFAILQQRLQRDVRDGRQGRWADGHGSWIDRNRNGVDDRFERRSDWDRDGRWDGRDGWVDRNRNGVDDRYERIRDRRERDDDDDD